MLCSSNNSLATGSSFVFNKVFLLMILKLIDSYTDDVIQRDLMVEWAGQCWRQMRRWFCLNDGLAVSRPVAMANVNLLSIVWWHIIISKLWLARRWHLTVRHMSNDFPTPLDDICTFWIQSSIKQPLYNILLPHARFKDMFSHSPLPIYIVIIVIVIIIIILLLFYHN